MGPNTEKSEQRCAADNDEQPGHKDKSNGIGRGGGVDERGAQGCMGRVVGRPLYLQQQGNTFDWKIGDPRIPVQPWRGDEGVTVAAATSAGS